MISSCQPSSSSSTIGRRRGLFSFSLVVAALLGGGERSTVSAFSIIDGSHNGGQHHYSRSTQVFNGRSQYAAKKTQLSVASQDVDLITNGALNLTDGNSGTVSVLPSTTTASPPPQVNVDPFTSAVSPALDAAETNTNHERYKAISLQSLDKVAEVHPELKPHFHDIKLAGLVFPFKASPYYVDELIDWSLGPDGIKEDPFYKLVFPTLDMLTPAHRQCLEEAHAAGNPSNLLKVVADIRRDLNPHPAGQTTLNNPKQDEQEKDKLTGVQHKYSETVLVFPAAGQTCHAYCTYCFRWAQFIGDEELRFAQKEASSLFDYLSSHPEVSDILMTGGDPMVMKTKTLAQYLEPLCHPNFLPHIQNLRIGTRSLSFWPQRFLTDPDADELITLLRRVRDEGGRHVAIMAHLGHPRELSTTKFEQAVERIQLEAGATIRSQSPIMRGINDDSNVWANKWRKEVSMGIIPYYMFMARDTGAQHYFDVPLAKAHRLYSDALRNCSGLIRTARGPSMSCTPGKVEVTGVEEIMGHKAFVLRFLQCRDEGWIGHPFFAKYDAEAVWFDDLQPLPGMELPWDENGLPRPVPSSIN